MSTTPDQAVGALRRALEDRDSQIAILESHLEGVAQRVTKLENTPAPSPAAPTISVGDPGYTTVSTWEKAVEAVERDENVYLDRPVTVVGEYKLRSKRVFKFGPQGALIFGRGRVTLDMLPINEDNHQIFENFEAFLPYPARWDATGGSILGTFGGDSVRDVRWWGLDAYDGDDDESSASHASALERQRNINAIHGAMISRPFLYGTMVPVTVKFPMGRVPINQPVRCDGMKVTLQGDGSTALGTQLWADWIGGEFESSHYVKMEDFLDGTVPVVELGYERQPNGRNPDEGFASRMENLTVICPTQRTAGPITGILLGESGYQEQSGLKNVAVAYYSGYGIATPHYQRLEHNGPPQSYYPQANSFVLEDIWVHSPSQYSPKAIGVSIFGLNWELRNATIHHHFSKQEIHTSPAMQCGARECGRVSQVHFEHNPKPGSVAPCILIPNDGKGSRMHIDGAYGWLAGNLTQGKISEVVRIENPYASVACHNVNHRTGTTEPLNQNSICISDVPRAKKSDGQLRRYGSKCVASYIRQRHHNLNGQYVVESSDPGLR